MSYDLMVFNHEVAPQSEIEFLKWYDIQTEWNESHNYVDPIVASNNLKHWFNEIINEFPALNGPFAPANAEDLESEYVADYTIGKNIIYVSFRWSVAEKAYSTMLELAEKHQVGFYDASGSGDILFPNQKGTLDSILPRIERRKWWKIWKKAL
jgi:hypothetical protein